MGKDLEPECCWHQMQSAELGNKRESDSELRQSIWKPERSNTQRCDLDHLTQDIYNRRAVIS